MPTQYKYDIFISYSHKDSAWVTGVLLPKLEQHGFTVFIDFRDFQSGGIFSKPAERSDQEFTILLLRQRGAKQSDPKF